LAEVVDDYNDIADLKNWRNEHCADHPHSH
jgi:hypothetical protein